MNTARDKRDVPLMLLLSLLLVLLLELLKNSRNAIYFSICVGIGNTENAQQMTINSNSQ